MGSCLSRAERASSTAATLHSVASLPSTANPSLASSAGEPHPPGSSALKASMPAIAEAIEPCQNQSRPDLLAINAMDMRRQRFNQAYLDQLGRNGDDKKVVVGPSHPTPAAPPLTPRGSAERLSQSARDRSSSEGSKRSSDESSLTGSLIGQKLPTVPERFSEERSSAEVIPSGRPLQPQEPSEEQMLAAIMRKSTRPFRDDQARQAYLRYLAKGEAGKTPCAVPYSHARRRPRYRPAPSLRLSEHSSIESVPSTSLSDVAMSEDSSS